MELDRETQIRILEEHFTGCLNFWKHQGMDEKAAEESALRELRQVKNNPFPHARALWIRQSWRKLRTEFNRKSNDVT